MRKKIPLKSGFTIAEVLISMLIVMVVAAAMIPVIGPKKLKSMGSTTERHGVAECYWDENGVLQYYYADNGANRGGRFRDINGDYCEFNVPDAIHIDIYAIGAGSEGIGNDGNGIGVVPGDDQNNNWRNHGDISPNGFPGNINSTNIHASVEGIDDIPGLIRGAFTRWAQKIEQEEPGSYLYLQASSVKSPFGGNGAARYKQIGNNSAECDYGQDVDCMNQSASYETYTGGYGGKILKLIGNHSILVPVDGTHGYQINYAGNSSNFTFRSDFGGSLGLTKSKPGGDAWCEVHTCKKGNSYNDREKTNGQNNWSTFSQEIETGNPAIKVISGASTDNLSKKYFTQADISVSYSNYMSSSNYGASGGTFLWDTFNRSFSWALNEPSIKVRYGGAGEAGDIRYLTFANISGTLFLRPGRNVNGQTTDTRVTTNGLEGSPIIEAASHGIPGVANETESYTPDEVEENPAYPPQYVIDAAIPDNSRFIKYISALNSTAVYGQGGLLNCNRQEQNGNIIDSCPGYAGTGAFPLITNLDEFKNTLVLTNNQAYAKSMSQVHMRYVERLDGQQVDVNQNNNINIDCPDGLINPNAGNANDIQYCRAVNPGNRDGAVIIIW